MRGSLFYPPSCAEKLHYTELTGFHLGGGGGRKGATAPPWIICAPLPLGFKILNNLPVYGQLVTLTIRSNF